MGLNDLIYASNNFNNDHPFCLSDRKNGQEQTVWEIWKASSQTEKIQ